VSIPIYTTLNDLPAPVTTGGIQAFTDVYGEQWVAKPGVYNGSWRKARDVLHAVIYRNAALANMPTSSATFIAYDTVLRDVYGMFSSNGFLIPAAGWYRIQATGNTNAAAIGQYATTWIFGGPSAGTTIGQGNNVTVLASGGMSCRAFVETVCAVNDLIKSTTVQPQGNAGQVGQGNMRLEISYIGAG
jgi:hypothetical protein